MRPTPEGERRREHDEVQNPRNPLKRPAFRGYFERIERWTTATLEWVSEPDEWKKRLAKTAKISPTVENKPFLEVLWGNEIEIDEIPCFIQPSRTSARWERRASRISRFCEGGEFVLQNAIAGDPERSNLTGTQELEAWVSDRNWVEESLVGPRHEYPRILDNKRLYLVLQKKRFPEVSEGDYVGPPRRIYIKNPNGASVVAMIKTTPASQVEGFRHLFADYITATPEPKFMLRESPWWGGCFVMSFNIPYHGISTQKLQDCRTVLNGAPWLRNRYYLDFLHLKDQETSDDERSSFHDQAILHEAVYSLTVTGKSDKYWTAVCLDDHFFYEESNLESDEETLELDGKSDPILHQAVLEAEGDLTKSPRSYAVAALKMALEKIVEHHANIQDWFKASFSLHTSNAKDGPLSKISTEEVNTWLEKFPETLSRVTYSTSNLVTKLDHFLKEDVIFGQDGMPRGVLWQSLQHDPNALRSLLEIQQYRNQLRDIAGELRQLALACKEVRRQRQADSEGEQHIITGRVYRAAIAAFGFAILNTVAQLYSAKPSNDEPGSWPSYVAMVVFCILMGVVIAVYLFWQQVRQWFKGLAAFLPGTPRVLRGRP